MRFLNHAAPALMALLLLASGASGSCASFPDVACEAGSFPLSDSEVDGDWWPSRSTHYYYTAYGACAFNLAPNCASASETWLGNCSAIPSVILKAPYAGNYAAPQGDYYSQKGPYLSCGECFEVKCVDSQCSSFKTVTLQIADSCPCSANPNWCCNNYSTCTSITNDLNGYPHCPLKSGALWDSKRSIHLDLNDRAMALIATGNASNTNLPGVINTVARRVSCNVVGNLWGLKSSWTTPTESCTSGTTTGPCFYSLAFTILNVGGAGSVNKVQVYSGADSTWISLNQSNSATSSSVPQEIWGQWISPTRTAVFFPIKIKMTNRYLQTVTAEYTYSSWPTSEWWDFGVQFPDIPSSSSTASSKCSLSSLPTGASAWNTCSASVTDGSSCSFTCSSGYTAVTGVCSAGTWTTTPTCVSDGSCSLSLPTGASDYGTCSSTVTTGTTCSLECDSGYTAVSGTCSSGSWTKSPSCTANPCTLSSKPTGASGWGTCNTSVASGSSCAFACESSYTSQTGVCAAGSWTTAPTCVAAGGCTVSLSTGAESYGTCSASVSSGTTCSLTCSTGYSAVSGTCTSGSWDTTPYCKAASDASTGLGVAAAPLVALILSCIVASLRVF